MSRVFPYPLRSSYALESLSRFNTGSPSLALSSRLCSARSFFQSSAPSSYPSTSQSDSWAPFPTQFRHGMKRLLGIRLALPIFGVALSIAYKFSFENVSTEDTIQISNVALVEAGDFVGAIRFTYSVHDEPPGSSWAWGRDVDSFPKLNADIPRRPSFGVECHKFIAARSSSNMPSALLRSIRLFLFSYSFHRAKLATTVSASKTLLGARLSSTSASPRMAA